VLHRETRVSNLDQSPSISTQDEIPNPIMSKSEPVAVESAAAPVADVPKSSIDIPYTEEATGDISLPEGWKYRGRRIFGFNIPWYASPKIQLGMVAFVCFMCPGMFNALGGLGGGGKTDATLADNMVSGSGSLGF
jgi:hypothetical protein